LHWQQNFGCSGSATMTCPECDGSGVVERVNWHGFYEAPCPHCYDGLGEVNDDEVDDE
jgi:DnaJ-class molecular chaperone